MATPPHHVTLNASEGELDNVVKNASGMLNNGTIHGNVYVTVNDHVQSSSHISSQVHVSQKLPQQE